MQSVRVASSTWHSDYTELLVSHGSVLGRASPATIYSGKFGGVRGLALGYDCGADGCVRPPARHDW